MEHAAAARAMPTAGPYFLREVRGRPARPDARGRPAHDRGRQLVGVSTSASSTSSFGRRASSPSSSNDLPPPPPLIPSLDQVRDPSPSRRAPAQRANDDWTKCRRLVGGPALSLSQQTPAAGSAASGAPPAEVLTLACLLGFFPTDQLLPSLSLPGDNPRPLLSVASPPSTSHAARQPSGSTRHRPRPAHGQTSPLRLATRTSSRPAASLAPPPPVPRPRPIRKALAVNARPAVRPSGSLSQLLACRMPSASAGAAG